MDYTVVTDFETMETVFTLGINECRVVAVSGAEALKAFLEWRKANGL